LIPHFRPKSTCDILIKEEEEDEIDLELELWQMLVEPSRRFYEKMESGFGASNFMKLHCFHLYYGNIDQYFIDVDNGLMQPLKCSRQNYEELKKRYLDMQH